MLGERGVRRSHSAGQSVQIRVRAFSSPRTQGAGPSVSVAASGGGDGDQCCESFSGPVARVEGGEDASVAPRQVACALHVPIVPVELLRQRAGGLIAVIADPPQPAVAVLDQGGNDEPESLVVVDFISGSDRYVAPFAGDRVPQEIDVPIGDGDLSGVGPLSRGLVTEFRERCRRQKPRVAP